jgi:hypothetical protein
MGGWMDGWMDRWVDGWVGRWMDGLWEEEWAKPGSFIYCVTVGRSPLLTESHIAQLENGISLPNCAWPNNFSYGSDTHDLQPPHSMV